MSYIESVYMRPNLNFFRHTLPPTLVANSRGNDMIKNFVEQLRIQRWDDHRYYHHSRINQSLHFVSAVSFMVGYVMMIFDPLVAALIGWLVSMSSRQAGHFSLVRFRKMELAKAA